MYERSDEQFVNAARYRAVRRSLIAKLSKGRKGIVFGMFGIGAALLIQAGMVVMPLVVPSYAANFRIDAFYVWSAMLCCLYFVCLVGMQCSLSVLDTRIKTLKMLDVLDDPERGDPTKLKPAAFVDAFTD